MTLPSPARRPGGSTAFRVLLGMLSHLLAASAAGPQRLMPAAVGSPVSSGLTLELQHVSLQKNAVRERDMLIVCLFE